MTPLLEDGWMSIYDRPLKDGLYEYWHSGMGSIGRVLWERGEWRAHPGSHGIVMRGKDLWRYIDDTT